MSEFEGAFEGIGVAAGADVSLTEALALALGLVLAVAGDVGSRDARSGNRAGGGYFWKKRSRRGGSDFAISADFWVLMAGYRVRVRAQMARRAGMNIKSPNAKTGLSCEVALSRVELASRARRVLSCYLRVCITSQPLAATRLLSTSDRVYQDGPAAVAVSEFSSTPPSSNTLLPPPW